MSLVITNIKGMGYRYKKPKVNFPLPTQFVVGCAALQHQPLFTMLLPSTLQHHSSLLYGHSSLSQHISPVLLTYWASCTVYSVVCVDETVVCAAKPPV